MIEFISYVSGSEANMYEVRDGKTRILIECGLSWKKMQRLTGHSMTGFDACLLTHEHKDHSKGVADVLRAGIETYMTAGTFAELVQAGRLAELHGYSAVKVLPVDPIFDLNAVEEYQQIWISDDLAIKPFKIQHDACDPVGYLIMHYPSKDQLVFLTDTFYSRYRFPGTTHWVIECNYSPDLVPANCLYRDRLYSSHMSLQQCIKTLKANDLSRTREIHLIHLSEGNSDAERFKREVQEATGVPVYVAPKRREL